MKLLQKRTYFRSLFITGLCTGRALAQSTSSSSACPTLSPAYPAPVVASGWQAQLIATGLSTPRSILFDSNGHLLLVQSGRGVVNLELADNSGICVSVAKQTYMINSTEVGIHPPLNYILSNSGNQLNHGIALSNDGKTLYASSSATVFSWSYDAASQTVSGTNKTLITGMNNTDHMTRTLLMSQMQPGILVVSRGSATNEDSEADDILMGHSQLRAFNVSNVTATSPPYDFTTSGRLLGWGLRNSVGLAEEPLTGGIYSVENSVDQITRDGIDIHQNNPGEEMNFHGYLNSSTENQGGNYGYPDCFALWDTDIPDVGSLQVGNQFTTDPNSVLNDTTCSSSRIPPRLTFQAHMAPLDIIFLPNGTEAYVTFHGSWDRTVPVGYKLSAIAFANGSPVAASDSKTALTDIFSNQNNSNCPDSCFRPVGLARDDQGRIFMTSDATGEIWVLMKTAAQSSTTGASPTATQTPNGAASAGIYNIRGLLEIFSVLAYYLL
jgi:glucose/arabinose dehydrogenase